MLNHSDAYACSVEGILMIPKNELLQKSQPHPRSHPTTLSISSEKKGRKRASKPERKNPDVGVGREASSPHPPHRAWYGKSKSCRRSVSADHSRRGRLSLIHARATRLLAWLLYPFRLTYLSSCVHGRSTAIPHPPSQPANIEP